MVNKSVLGSVLAVLIGSPANAQEKIFTLNNDPIGLVTLERNGNRLAWRSFGTKKSYVAIFDMKTDKLIAKFWDDDSFLKLAEAKWLLFSRDGKYLMADHYGFDSDAKQPYTFVSYWNLETGKQERFIDLKGFCYGMTEQFILVRENPQTKKNLVAFNLETGKTVELNCPSPLVSATASPDGKHFVTVAKTNVKTWDARTGKVLASIDTFGPATVTSFPKENQVAFGLWVVELSSGKTIEKEKDERIDVAGMTISPDRKVAVTFEKITFYDEGKRELRQFPKGIQFLSTAARNVVLATIEGKNDWKGASNFLFTPDGRYLIARTDGTVIRMWELSNILPPKK